MINDAFSRNIDTLKWIDYTWSAENIKQQITSPSDRFVRTLNAFTIYESQFYNVIEILVGIQQNKTKVLRKFWVQQQQN